MYIAYISVSKPIPWAVAGPHGQLASYNIGDKKLRKTFLVDKLILLYTCTFVSPLNIDTDNISARNIQGGFLST